MENTSAPLEPNWGQRNKLLIVASAGVILLLLIVTTLFVVNRSRQSSHPNNQTSNPGSNFTTNTSITPTQPKKIYPNPKITIKSWVDPTRPQNIPISGNIYTLKQNFSTSDIKELATKLGTNQTLKEDNRKILSYTVNKQENNVSVMTFDKASGAMSYSSTVGLPLNANKTLSEKVYELLTSLNLYDPTILVTATYKNRDNPNLTYVELHRDWNKVGIPILNVPGLLNLQENQSLATLTLQTKPDEDTENAKIYNTSDDKDGLARQTDFNTITLAIYETNNTVYSIHSNIRPLQKNSPDVAPLMEYDQLLSKLKSGQHNFFMASPSGSGVITWDKVFPNNQGSSNQAVITDAIYAYVESPPKVAQTTFEPYVIFRGYSTLDNGYRISWVATVSATQPQSLTQKLLNFIKPVAASENNLSSKMLAQAAPTCDLMQTQNICDANCDSPESCVLSGGKVYCCQVGATPNINKTPQQGDANASTSPGPTVPQAIVPTSPAGCKPNVNTASDWIAFVKVNASMILGLSPYQAGYRNKDATDSLRKDITYWTLKNPVWYYIPQQENMNRADFEKDVRFLQDNAGNIEKALRAAVPGVDFVFFIKDELRSVERALQDFDDAKQIVGPGCPIRVTGGSPSIFVYGKEGTQLTIKPQANLLYTDPLFATNGWNITVGAHQLTVNGTGRDYLYYEYQPIALNKPSHGWRVEKENINNLAQTIAKSLKLTTPETQRLAYELQYAAHSITNNELFVGLIDQNEVHAKLPLQVSPQPQSITRYHFYVAPASDKASVTAPQLKAMERKEFMVVEFGSYAGE